MHEHDIKIHVHYPAETGRLTLRTDLDWEKDLEPVAIEEDGTRSTFELKSTEPFHYFKPILWQDNEKHWAQGNNYLALTHAGGTEREIYPYFFGDRQCSVCTLRELEDGERQHKFRVFYPPGYDENTLKSYPVLYMQDGQNLFFPNEAFMGRDWKVDETLGILDQMSAVDKVIVVGIYPQDRMEDYTSPGFDSYGRFLTQTLKPYVDTHYRTRPERENTAVMGSSLGGVVSFHLAWQHPEIFGMAACMSSTFGYRDTLRERVAEEEKRPTRFYLDSGWPRDNYEVTRDMRTLMVRRGYDEGDDLFYFAFPEAMHNESAWAMRVHLPFQLFFGRPRLAV